MNLSEENYWTQRYEEARTGWDVGSATPPITSYLNQLIDKNIHILIPGAGNAYEAAYAWKNGFKNVTVLDISSIPLQQFAEKYPDFPKEQLVQEDFFAHQGTYDLILEQTFFCSFPPTKANRTKYATKIHELLCPKGTLAGVWFDFPLLEGNMDKRPFGGTKEEYLSYLSPLLFCKVFERCTNSIPPRQGNELFGIFKKDKKLKI